MKKNASLFLALSVFAVLIVLVVISAGNNLSSNHWVVTPILRASGSPLPLPTPPPSATVDGVLTASGSPLPLPTPPPSGTIIASGSPLPLPTPPNQAVAA